VKYLATILLAILALVLRADENKRLNTIPVVVETNGTHRVIAAGSTTARTVQERFAERFNVLDYGASTNLAVDSTAGISNAIVAAEVLGGEVWFPTPGLYKVTSQFIIDSRYPVHLRSEMVGGGRNGYTNQSAIVLGASIGTNFLFTYKSPTANRMDNGSGTISGLYITDLTASVGQPGTYTCGGIFSLYDFNYGSMHNVLIEHINGIAIRTDCTIKSRFEDITLQYNTRGLVVDKTDGTYYTQASTFENFMMEVMHGRYLEVVTGNQHNKFSKFQFEADTTYGTSSTNFAVLGGNNNSYDTFFFNRNTNTQLLVTGTFEKMHNFNFQGTANAALAGEVSGNYNELIAPTFNSGKTSREIILSGQGNKIVGATAINSGSFLLSGAGNIIDGGYFQNGFVTWTNSEWIWITNDCTINGTTLIGFAGTGNGVRLSGTTPKLVNSTIKAMGNYGWYNESPNAMVGQVQMYNNTYDFTNTISTPNILNNFMNSQGEYLQGSATWDPPSIASGVHRTVNITVTNAAPGDGVDVGFSGFDAGIWWKGDIYANNTVTVSAWNVSNAAINPGSGTVTVKVRKKFDNSANNSGTVTEAALNSWRTLVLDANGGTATNLTILGGNASTLTVNDDAYAIGWNGSTNVATKNAIYDEMETKQDALTTGLGVTNVNNVLSNNVAAGSGITITAGSNGQLTFAATAAAAITYVTNDVQTTDGTETTIATIATSSDTITSVHAEVFARTSDTDKFAHWDYISTWKNDGGTLTSLGYNPLAEDVAPAENTDGWLMNVDSSTTNIRLRVQNNEVDGETINWRVIYHVRSY
jgi:hypothetical protein